MIDFYSYQLMYVGAFGVASLVLLARRSHMLVVRVLVLAECLMLAVFLQFNGYLYTWVPYQEIPSNRYGSCDALRFVNWGVRYFAPVLAIVAVYVWLTWGKVTDKFHCCTANNKIYDWMIFTFAGLLALGHYFVILMILIWVAYIYESCQTFMEPLVNAIVCFVFLVLMVALVIYVRIGDNADRRKEEELKLVKEANTI